jgi:hypothetical protein
MSSTSPKTEDKGSNLSWQVYRVTTSTESETGVVLEAIKSTKHQRKPGNLKRKEPTRRGKKKMSLKRGEKRKIDQTSDNKMARGHVLHRTDGNGDSDPVIA